MPWNSRARTVAGLASLLRRSDVLLEKLRPDVLDRLDSPNDRLSELNPGLVVFPIPGFGHDGPEGGRAGYQVAQGEAGPMSLTGSGPEDPQRVGVPIGARLAVLLDGDADTIRAGRRGTGS